MPIEGVLHERIEPLGRLVEDRQLRVVLERLHHADLLPHPAGVVAHLSLEDRCRQLEPIAQLRAPMRLAALQVDEVVEHLLAA